MQVIKNLVSLTIALVALGVMLVNMAGLSRPAETVVVPDMLPVLVPMIALVCVVLLWAPVVTLTVSDDEEDTDPLEEAREAYTAGDITEEEMEDRISEALGADETPAPRSRRTHTDRLLDHQRNVDERLAALEEET